MHIVCCRDIVKEDQGNSVFCCCWDVKQEKKSDRVCCRDVEEEEEVDGDEDWIEPGKVNNNRRKRDKNSPKRFDLAVLNS